MNVQYSYSPINYVIFFKLAVLKIRIQSWVRIAVKISIRFRNVFFRIHSMEYSKLL
jgi:hypothetical protein